MTVDLIFPVELLRWAESAGYDYGPPAPVGTELDSFVKGRAYFSSPGGETIYFIEQRSDGWFTVTSSDRMSREYFEVGTRSQRVLERYFYGCLGLAIRSSRGLPLLALLLPKDLPSGYYLGPAALDGFSGCGLFTPAGELIAVGWYDSGIPELIQLALLESSPLADIETSCLSPDGGPVFVLMPSYPLLKPTVEPLPADVDPEDVRELVKLIEADRYVNGREEDVLADRRAWSGDRPRIRTSVSWDCYAYIFYVGEGYTTTSGFRFDWRQAPVGFTVPFGVSEETERLLSPLLLRIRDAGDLPVEKLWNAVVVTYDRNVRTGQVHFFYGAAAEEWAMNPVDVERIADRARVLARQIKGD